MTKNTKVTERKCRKNIAQMLSLMGFNDNNITAAVTVRNMLAKLRQNQENKNQKLPTTTSTLPAVAVNNNRSTNKRIVIKLGGKRCVIDQESPLSVLVPLQPPHSKTQVESCNKIVDLKDSRNINPSCSSRMMIVGDHDDGDVILELKNIEILESTNNLGCSENPNYVEEYPRNNMTAASSENPSTSSTGMNVLGDQRDAVMMEFMNGDKFQVSGSRKNHVVCSENANFNKIRVELRVDNVRGFITSIGGVKAKLFIKKKLTDTDVKGNHGRLLMPGKQVVDQKSDNLLTSDEKVIMGTDNKLSVTVFDPQKRTWYLNLGQWRMGSNVNYVLKTNWRKLVETNKLKEHMNIQVWTFRNVHDKLCFAVVGV